MESEPDDLSVAVEDLPTWRSRLLERLLVVVFFAGWLVGVPSAILAVTEQLWPLVVADIVALLWISHLYFFRTRRHVQRSVQLLALLYLMGVVLLVTVGYASQIYLMALPVLAVLLLSLRVAVLCLALNGLTLLAVGYWVDIDTGMHLLAGQAALRWLAITLNFLLVDTALTVACAFLLRGMESALRKQMEDARQLAHNAMHDGLTGLANRRLLLDRMALAVAAAARGKAEVAVFLLDLDHFKHINDSLGHALGDTLIEEVADRLQEVVRSGDTVARLGGDEFVVLLPELDNEAELLAAVERVLGAVGGRYRLEGQDLHVSASIGVAVYPRDGHDAPTLLKNADSAMYRAKDNGRNRFCFYESAMNERLVARMELERALHEAIEHQQFLLYFQPRVQANGCTSAEALIRWQHPQWGLVSPAQFIPVAEETGLIVPISAWVLQTAARHLGQWQREFPGLRISVNLSARDFSDSTLRDRVQAAVARVQPHTLEVEVTEGVVMDNLAAAKELLCQIRRMGVSVALDDFGTGFSSLAYLKAFPLDILKIDQSFVRGLDDNPRDAAIVKTIVDLASNLELNTVAEGVETQVQADVLRRLGVDELQGFLFAKPMSAADFEVWLRNASGSAAMAGTGLAVGGGHEFAQNPAGLADSGPGALAPQLL